MATQMPVAPAVRQPFAPLNQSRLQSLTSIKNRQNAIASSPSKRKAPAYDYYDNDDSENIDPVFTTSPKRSKALDGASNAIFKPSQFILTNAPPSPNDQSSVFKPSTLLSPIKTRPILSARSPLKITSPKAPSSAPAGRSPTRKRAGILNRRRSGGSPNGFTRIDPPGKSALASGLPFSLDAALKGTLPSYARRNTITNSSPPRTASRPAMPTPTISSQSSTSTSSLAADMIAIPELYQPAPKESWYFEIHEDTVEEENTNLMYHSTCTLDISSDEESPSISRIRDQQNKENLPPMDDQSQTSYRTSYRQEHESAGSALKARISKKAKDFDACDVDRSPLGEMPAEDFYDDGFDANSAFVVLDDVYEEFPVEEREGHDEAAYEAAAASLLKSQNAAGTFDFSTVPQIRIEEREVEAEGNGKSIEELMSINEDVQGAKAKVLEPIEKAEEGWKIWESGSVSGGE